MMRKTIAKTEMLQKENCHKEDKLHRIANKDHRLYTIRIIRLPLWIVVFVMTLTLISRVWQHDKAEPKKPHILLIVADDLGYNDIGYNNPDVKTPHLDELAKQGAILDSHYSLPLCSPSRAALLTGLYPHKTGIQHAVLRAALPHCLPENIPLLSDHLKAGGYQTHLIGKWHLGGCKWSCTPTHRGFDSFYGMLNGMQTYTTHKKLGGYDWWNGTEVDRSVIGRHATDLITGRTLELIDTWTETDPPMFLFMSQAAVHVPLEVDKQWKDLYPRMEEPRKTYLGMVSHMDEGIGKVVKTLKEKGMWDNSLVVFMSDNGGDVAAMADNSPFRGAKCSLYEGGTRTVAFISGGKIEKKGIRLEGLFHLVDWLPTILKITDVEQTLANHTATLSKLSLDGMDLSRMLLNDVESARKDFIYKIDLERTDHHPFISNIAIRKGRYKLIWGHPGLLDGYGTNLTFMDHNPIYLDMIGWKESDYLPISERTFVYARSAQEVDNLKSIGDIIGVYDLLKENQNLTNYGLTQLYDLEVDPEERKNLADDPDYHHIVNGMKQSVLERVRHEYRAPPSGALVMHQAEANYSRTDGVWAPGWCINHTTMIAVL